MQTTKRTGTRTRTHLGHPASPRILVCKRSPVGDQPVRRLAGDEVDVHHEVRLDRALDRCLREPFDLLFVNLFDCRPEELTALAMFRQARPAQYVAACAPREFLGALEEAGLADIFYSLERQEGSSSFMTQA